MESHTVITVDMTAGELDILTGIVEMHLGDYPEMAMIVRPLALKLGAQNAQVLRAMREKGT